MSSSLSVTATADQMARCEDAFWAAVAAEFPECETGDVDPLTDTRLTEMMRSAVNGWLMINHPDNRVPS